MAEPNYANVVTTSTFAQWLATTNQIVEDMGSVVITTTPNVQPNTTVGGYTSGNAHVEGVFGANTVAVGSGIRGGSVSVPGTLNITSNTYFANSANVTIGSNTNNFNINANNTTITGLVQVTSSKTVNISSANTVIVAGTLYATTNTVFSGNTVIVNAGALTVNTAATFTGDVTVNGNTVLGDATTDRVNIIAYLGADLLPANTTIDLGSAAQPYGNVVTTIVYSANAELTGTLLLNGTAQKNILVTGTGGSYQSLALQLVITQSQILPLSPIRREYLALLT